MPSNPSKSKVLVPKKHRNAPDGTNGFVLVAPDYPSPSSCFSMVKEPPKNANNRSVCSTHHKIHSASGGVDHSEFSGSGARSRPLLFGCDNMQHRTRILLEKKKEKIDSSTEDRVREVLTGCCSSWTCSTVDANRRRSSVWVRCF